MSLFYYVTLFVYKQFVVSFLVSKPHLSKNPPHAKSPPWKATLIFNSFQHTRNCGILFPLKECMDHPPNDTSIKRVGVDTDSRESVAVDRCEQLAITTYNLLVDPVDGPFSYSSSFCCPLEHLVSQYALTMPLLFLKELPNSLCNYFTLRCRSASHPALGTWLLCGLSFGFLGAFNFRLLLSILQLVVIIACIPQSTSMQLFELMTCTVST